MQTERKWRVLNIFFASSTPFNSKSLYLFTLGVIINWFIRNPKNMIIDKLWSNKFDSWKLKKISKPDRIRPKLNSLGKNILKKFLVSSADKILKTTGETRIMKEIMAPNNTAARKFTI